MNVQIEAYPLTWPTGWPRCRYPASATFRTGLADARDGLYRELWMLGASSVVVSSNAPLNKNGEISSRQARLADPGVAVYFVLDGEQKSIPCDKWNRIEDNVQAIRLTVAALRGLERWGAKEIVAAAFRGFEALPEGAGAEWWSELGVARDASEVEVRGAYHRLMKAHHPDTGDGDVVAVARAEWAYRVAREQRSA